MKMIDVGQQYGGTVEAPKKDEKYYPCLHLQADDLPGLNEVGKDVILVVKGNVKSLRKDEEGIDVEIEVRECGVADKDVQDSLENGADKDLEEMSGSNSRY